MGMYNQQKNSYECSDNIINVKRTYNHHEVNINTLK